jgi:hypothetical protein
MERSLTYHFSHHHRAYQTSAYCRLHNPLIRKLSKT